MSWDPNALKRAAKKSGVQYDVDADWLKIDPYKGGFQPVGVVWHHTATKILTPGNMPSLGWCRNPGQYAGEARACHVVVGRDGALQIIAGRGAYHAGAGGPMRVNGTYIPKDLGNRYLIGIEIEAASTNKINKKDRQTPKTGMNPAQFEAVAKFCAALFDDLGWETEAAIRHRDWAPGRKIDVGIPLSEIRDKIDSYRKAPSKPATPAKPKPEKPATATKPKPTAPAKPKPEKKPVVNFNSIKPGRKNKQVLVVQEALKKEYPSFDYSSGPGMFGPRTKAAYAKWQTKIGEKKATGVPTLTSLRKLGEKHGFTVKSQ
jgi:N-acetylmuramoyl-L-alanine amidase CwlA